MSSRRVHLPRARSAAALVAVVLGASGLAACESGPTTGGLVDPGAPTSAGQLPVDVPTSASPIVPAGKLLTNVKRGARDIPVDRQVKVIAHDLTLDTVDVSSSGASLPGQISSDGSGWVASELLEPGTRYTIHAVGRDVTGQEVVRDQHFTTVALTLDQQTYPSVAPLDGETVGVGMPVIVTFDVPVTDRTSIQKHLTVTSTPAQKGSWHWMSDTEVHWRPKRYWQPGTDVQVDADINGVAAGNGIYGQEDRSIDFHVGDAHVYKVDAQTDQMKVFSNGKLLRTLPVTTGKPGFTTRSGVKVIIEKFDVHRMNSETIGIGKDDPEYYDIDDVQWAMRLTYSGEFIHAAPWSVSSQGHENVSHGCTGMSTENAKWLYDMSRRGDVVEYTGTDRPMEFQNGYGDWNQSYQQYRSGSAL